MNSLSVWQNALSESWLQVWTTLISILPLVVGAIVVFVVGLLLAFWIKKLVMRVLIMISVDKLAKESGIDKYLKKAEIKPNFIELLGTAIEWSIILVFFLAVVDILGLNAVSNVLTQVVAFIPNVLAAALILGVGYLIAGVVDGVVRGSLSSVDHEIAKPLGRLARWVILIVTFFASIDQLQIAQGLIQTLFQGLSYTVVLVVGLSVGLGSKDLVAKILDDWYTKISKK